MEGEDKQVDGVEIYKEKPREGLKVQKQKKQRTNSTEKNTAHDDTTTAEETASKETKSEKMKAKRERKRERKFKKQSTATTNTDSMGNISDSAIADVQTVDELKSDVEKSENPSIEPSKEIPVQDIDPNKPTNEIPATNGSHESSSASPSIEIQSTSSVMSASQSPSSAPSSIVPPKNGEDVVEQETPAKLPKINSELLRSRLQARIDALRAARKADGIDGKPAKNRQELMEARRRKEKLRRAHKKELRAKSKQDEKAAAEAELARLRGSGSPSSIDIFSPRHTNNQFSFGRVSFGDGEQANSTFSTIIDPRKKKGPQDPRTALQALEKKQDRINNLDEKKKAEIEEKNLWLSAKMKAHGENVKDDKSLLKKTLKRKESAKSKSEKEWNKRAEGIEKSKEMRQQKRENNLRTRKENKGSKGSKNKPSGKKQKGRPGFEGSFRTRPK